MSGDFTRGFAFLGLGLVSISLTVLITEQFPHLPPTPHVEMALYAMFGSLLIFAAGLADLMNALAPIVVTAIGKLRQNHTLSNHD